MGCAGIHYPSPVCSSSCFATQQGSLAPVAIPAFSLWSVITTSSLGACRLTASALVSLGFPRLHHEPGREVPGFLLAILIFKNQ